MSPRRRLLRWAGWVAVANAALVAVVGLRYLCYDSALGAAAAWRYAHVAFVGHVSALACVPLVLLLVPVIAVVARPRVVVSLGIVPERVTIVFPASYGMRDWGYRLARVQTQPREVPRAAMQEIGRFNR